MVETVNHAKTADSRLYDQNICFQLQINETFEPLPESGYAHLHMLTPTRTELFGIGIMPRDGRNVLSEGPLDLKTAGVSTSRWLRAAAMRSQFMSAMTKGKQPAVRPLPLLSLSICSVALSTFAYKPTKPAKDKTRIYFSIDRASPLSGQPPLVLDASNALFTHITIEAEAVVELQSAFVGTPSFTLANGNRDLEHAANCSHRRPFLAQKGTVHILELRDSSKLKCIGSSQWAFKLPTAFHAKMKRLCALNFNCMMTIQKPPLVRCKTCEQRCRSNERARALLIAVDDSENSAYKQRRQKRRLRARESGDDAL